MSEQRLRIELYPNTDYHAYHLTGKLPIGALRGGYYGYDQPTVSARTVYRTRYMSSQERLAVEQLDRRAQQDAGLFFAIPGVDKLSVEPGKVTIQRSRSYDWTEIDPKVTELLLEIMKWQTSQTALQWLVLGQMFEDEPSAQQFFDKKMKEWAKHEKRHRGRHFGSRIGVIQYLNDMP